MKMMTYIRFVSVAFLLLFNVAAWGDKFVFIGGTDNNNWNNKANWGKGQASPYGTSWEAADRLPQSGDCIYIKSDVQVTCPGNLTCADFYINPGAVFTCNGDLTSTGHIHMYGGTIVINGDIYCKNEFEQKGSASLKCTGSFTSENHVYLNGNVEVGSLNCKDVNVPNSSTFVSKGNVNTNGQQFIVDGNVTVEGDISSGYLVMSDSSSSLVCGGSVDTNGQDFAAKGDVDIAGDLNSGYLTLPAGKTFKVDGDFRSTQVSLWGADGCEFVVDVLPDAINHSVTDTERFLKDLENSGVKFHKIERFSWTGNKDSNWFDGANWGDGTGSSPSGIYSDVTISNTAKNMPVISEGDVLVRNITIDNTETRCCLTLNSGAKLNASAIYVSQFSNGGAVVINQTSSNMVSLHLKNNLYSKEASYNKTIINTEYPGNRYMYVGTETAEGNITIPSGALFYVHNHLTDTYIQASDLYSDPFNVGGVIAKAGAGSFTVSQTGTILPCGEKTLNVKRIRTHEEGNTWCLLSNPFSFAYPLSSLSCDENVDPVIWFDNYTGSGYQYSTYSVSTHVQVSDGVSVGSVMAPQQAFFVRASADAAEGAVGQLKFNQVPNDYTPSASSLKTASLENDVLRFTISSEGRNTDEMAMVFREGGSQGIIYGDAEKMPLEKTQNQVFAVKGNKHYSIPYYPSIEEVIENEFKLGVMLSSKSVKGVLTATNIDMFDESVDVFLCDHLTGNTINLRNTNSYEFEECGGKYITDRFSISFKENDNNGIATGETSVIMDNQEKSVAAYNSDGLIVVRASSTSLEAGDMRVRVYDVCGKVVKETIASGTITRIPLNTKGMYIVEVVSANISYSAKILML